MSRVHRPTLASRVQEFRYAQENKDTQTILGSTWHPRLALSHLFWKNNFHLISDSPKLSKIFKVKPTVTYRKNKSLSDYLLKNDIANQRLHSSVAPCRKCKLYPQINTAELITNGKLNMKKGTGNWKEREHNVPSTKYYILGIQENNFQSASSSIATTLKTGQTIANLKNFFTKVTI